MFLGSGLGNGDDLSIAYACRPSPALPCRTMPRTLLAFAAEDRMTVRRYDPLG
jgi:hypothetical protein